jgi:hypothetical protein
MVEIAHWPAHKELCKGNRQVAKNLEDRGWDDQKRMQAFARKHTPSLHRAGIVALGVRDDPSRAADYYLSVWLRKRPEGSAIRTETAYWVCAVEISRYSDTSPERAQRMKSEITYRDPFQAEQYSSEVTVNKFIIEIGCVDDEFVAFIPAAISPTSKVKLEFPPKNSWKEWLMMRMNNGIVC